jgi:hypothetical protein
MGCSCNSAKASTMSTPQSWQVVSPEGVVLSSYRTEIEAASAAARTPGATYRAESVYA